jgi:hypothetical protein
MISIFIVPVFSIFKPPAIPSRITGVLKGLMELGSQRLGSLIAVQLAPVSKIPVYELGAFLNSSFKESALF